MEIKFPFSIGERVGKLNAEPSGADPAGCHARHKGHTIIGSDIFASSESIWHVARDDRNVYCTLVIVGTDPAAEALPKLLPRRS